MSDLFWLKDLQMMHLEPFFLKAYGKPRVDDWRVLSRITLVSRNGVRWHFVPAEYGCTKTLYNRCKRWSYKGAFTRIIVGLVAEHGEQTSVMIDAAYRKACRTVERLHRGASLAQQPVERRLAPRGSRI
jgi:transposase